MFQAHQLAMELIVSILIQPEGWMLFIPILYWCTQARFQSSSSPKAGCYKSKSMPGRIRHDVSILIQPEGWML